MNAGPGVSAAVPKKKVLAMEKPRLLGLAGKKKKKGLLGGVGFERQDTLGAIKNLRRPKLKV